MVKVNKLTLSVVLIIAILAVVTLLSGCTNSNSSTGPTATTGPSVTPVPATIRLGYLANSGHVLTFVAKEEGYFAKYGLDVQLSLFPNSAAGYDALTAGKLDVITMGATAPAVYIAKGYNLTEFGGLMGEGTSAVTLPQNAEKYTDLKNWKGAKIATVRMSSGDVVYRTALKEAGLNASTDVTIDQLSTPAAVIEAVKGGKDDIGIIWLPYQYVAEDQGLTIVSFGDQYYPGHPCCRFTVVNTTLVQNKDVYVRLEKALIESYHFVKTNQSETVADVKKYADFNDSVIYDSIYKGHFTYSPDPNKKTIEKWWNDMKDIGYINSTENISNHVDTQVYKQALDEIIRENPNDSIYQELLSEYHMNDM